MVIICQPDRDIFDKAIEFYLILNKTDFYFIFIPCETYEIINFLNGPGIGNRYKVTNFNIDLIPIDNDLVSMERNGDFKEIYVDKNTAPISDFVDSFIKLEITFGKIKHKYIKGEKAELFNDSSNIEFKLGKNRLLMPFVSKDGFITNSDDISFADAILIFELLIYIAGVI